MLWKWTRSFATSAAARALPQGVPVAGHLKLPRNIVAISGPDSSKFLNGLLTIRPPDATRGQSSGKYGAMLNSKGRVVFDTFVYPAHGSSLASTALPGVDVAHCYLLEVDNELAERALRIFNFYKLQSQVEINLATPLDLWFAWNDDANIDLGKVNDSQSQNWLSAADDRAPGLGVRVISNGASTVAQEIGGPVDMDVYKLRRYLFGVPEGHEEIRPDKSLPLECCMDYMGGIDFHKGCYVGQELTIRTHHHGVVRKRIAPLVFTYKGEEIPEDLYIPREMPVAPGDAISDKMPLPNADMLEVSPFAPDSSQRSALESSNPGDLAHTNPFGSSPRRTSGGRSAGEVVSSLGNVGLGKIRIDKIGHEFELAGDISVTGLTPYWWPEAATN